MMAVGGGASGPFADQSAGYARCPSEKRKAGWYGGVHGETGQDQTKREITLILAMIKPEGRFPSASGSERAVAPATAERERVWVKVLEDASALSDSRVAKIKLKGRSP